MSSREISENTEYLEYSVQLNTEIRVNPSPSVDQLQLVKLQQPLPQTAL